MKTIQYVAMDVHQASITAVVRDREEKIRMRSVMETSARAVLDSLGGLRWTVWFTFEEGSHPVLKDVFKGAAQAAIGRPGPLKDLYNASVARGVSPEMAKLTLARKIASVTLRLWKRGERYDPAKLTMQAT
jgi:hypothetical protein